MSIQIPVDPQRIRDFCRKHRIIRLSVFGSVLRDDFADDSDVDVLVEFEPGKTPGLKFFTIQDELSQMLGRKVDLVTEKGLSRWIRNEVLSSMEILYAAS